MNLPISQLIVHPAFRERLFPLAAQKSALQHAEDAARKRAIVWRCLG